MTGDKDRLAFVHKRSHKSYGKKANQANLPQF